MKDIQVIRLLDVLPVTSIETAEGVSPRSIIVRGQDFSSVEQVLINGYPSPEFVTMSRTRIIAEVPLLLRNEVLTEAMVLSQRLTLTDRSFVEFTFGNRPTAVQGTVKLMQNFLRILLRSPRSNIFHPNSGGGMLRRIGSNISKAAAGDIALAVSRTREYLVKVQSPDRRIPASERLLSAEIARLDHRPEETAIDVTIVVTAHTGVRSASTLTL